MTGHGIRAAFKTWARSAQAVHSALQAGDDPRIPPEARIAVNASRIAGLSSIPRETMRRTLLAPEQRGRVVRTQNAGWRLAVNPWHGAAGPLSCATAPVCL